MTSLSVEQRRDNGYQHNKPLQNAIRKYGWAGFEHRILRDKLTQKEAFDLEREMIARLDATNPKNGYNISFGGKSTFAGLKHTEKHKEKMSDLYRGRKFSDETLKRMRKSHEKERHPVICFNEKREIIARYESTIQAAKAVNGYPSNITRACGRTDKPYKGFYWAACSEEVR